MGRRPHSPQELWLHGAAKSQAAAPTESAVRAGRPRYPAGLTPAARRTFKELCAMLEERRALDRKSTRLNSSHRCISYAVFCLKKKKKATPEQLWAIASSDHNAGTD